MAKIVTREGRRITVDEFTIDPFCRVIKARGSGYHYLIPLENISFIVFPDQEGRELQELEREGEQ